MNNQKYQKPLSRSLSNFVGAEGACWYPGGSAYGTACSTGGGDGLACGSGSGGNTLQGDCSIGNSAAQCFMNGATAQG
jgi:hypothetical protein